MKLLSIVIPTYNMQDYLQKCLDSLIVPQHQLSLFEAIVVNDGSEDGSSAIAHEYQERYPGTFRVIDKENGNYGSCVNRGLAEATGKYIRVLDADDYFDTERFSEYLTALSRLNEDVDIVLNDFSTVDGDGKIIEKKVHDIVPNEIFQFSDRPVVTSQYNIHNLSYRTELLRKIGYRSTEGIYYTDIQWCYIPMHAVNSCIYFPIDLYKYLLGREGQSMDYNVLTRNITHHIAISESLIYYYNKFPVEFKTGYIYRLINNETRVLSQTIYKLCLIEQRPKDFSRKELKEYDSILKKERPELYKYLGDNIVLNGLPFHYIRFWRRTGLRLPLALLRNAVRRIRYGNWRIHYGK